MLSLLSKAADKAPDKIWPANVCVMLDVRDIYFCVVFRGWPKVRDTALMLENVSTMWSFSLYNGAHYIVILMLLSRNKQKKAQLIMKNDHKSVGFLFSQNICPYVLVIERGIKLTMGKTLQQQSSFSFECGQREKRTQNSVICVPPLIYFQATKTVDPEPGFFVAVLTIRASCMLQPQIKTLKVRSHFENKAKSWCRGSSGSQFVFIPRDEGSAPCADCSPLIGCSPQYSPLIGQLLVTDAWSLNKGARLYLCLWLFPWHMLNIAPTPGISPLPPCAPISHMNYNPPTHRAKAGNQEMKTNFPPR